MEDKNSWLTSAALLGHIACDKDKCKGRPICYAWASEINFSLNFKDTRRENHLNP